MLLFQNFEFLDIGHIQPPVFGLPLVKVDGAMPISRQMTPVATPDKCF